MSLLNGRWTHSHLTENGAKSNQVVVRNVADAPSLTTDVGQERKAMPIELIIPILVAIALPTSWLIAEILYESKMARCLLGVLTILGCVGSSYFIIRIRTILEFRKSYGSATYHLVSAIKDRLNTGEAGVVNQELTKLQEQFRHFERINYNMMVEEAAQNLKIKKGVQPGDTPNPHSPSALGVGGR